MDIIIEPYLTDCLFGAMLKEAQRKLCGTKQFYVYAKEKKE